MSHPGLVPIYLIYLTINDFIGGSISLYYLNHLTPEGISFVVVVLLPQNNKLTENDLQLGTVPLSIQIQIRCGSISSPKGTIYIIRCALDQLSINNQATVKKLALMQAYNKSNLSNRIGCRIQDTSLLVLYLNPTNDLLWDLLVC